MCSSAKVRGSQTGLHVHICRKNTYVCVSKHVCVCVCLLHMCMGPGTYWQGQRCPWPVPPKGKQAQRSAVKGY